MTTGGVRDDVQTAVEVGNNAVSTRGQQWEPMLGLSVGRGGGQGVSAALPGGRGEGQGDNSATPGNRSRAQYCDS